MSTVLVVGAVLVVLSTPFLFQPPSRSHARRRAEGLLLMAFVAGLTLLAFGLLLSRPALAISTSASTAQSDGNRDPRRRS